MLGRLRGAPALVGRAASTTWGRLLTTAVAVVLFVHAVDLGDAMRLFRAVSPGWTVLALTLAAFSVMASVAEWGVLLRGTGHAMDWSFLGSWYLKGLFVNQVLPAGVGGDAVRALHLGRVTGHGPMVSSLVASRMAGTLGMSLWALAAAVTLRDLLHVPVFAGFVAFAAFMLVAWALALLAEAARARLSGRHPLLASLSRLMHPFTTTFEAYRSRPRILGASMLAGAAGWGLNLLSMEAFAIALGRDVSWRTFAVALPIALLATFVPISANGIGVREGVLVALLVHIDVPLGVATALSLFVDVQLLPFALVGGGVWLVEHHVIGRRRRPRPGGGRVVCGGGRMAVTAAVTVRSAGVPDAGDLGRVHVRAWQSAYRGAMPDDYLDALSVSDRAAMWARGLARGRPDAPVLVAELDGRVAGFAALGPAADPPGCGELLALNVDPDQWGRGVGRRLLGEAERRLADLGFDSAVLWVLPANRRARRLYEAAGWEPDGAERTAEVLGVTVPEMRYRRRLV